MVMKFRLLHAALGCALSGGLASAADLDFNFKVNQGSIDTTFATLRLQELNPGITTFTLDTALSGTQGNPGIVELDFGCNNCGNVTFTSNAGVTITSGGVQAGYDFDYRAAFSPAAVADNTPLTWTATGSPGAFMETTSGAGPSAVALIQLTGGTESISGQSITSGFYVAAAPVPEPSTYALMLAGIGLVGGIVHRKRSSPAKRS